MAVNSSVIDPFLQRHAGLAVQLVLTVSPRHSGVIGPAAGQYMVVDRDIVVRGPSVQREPGEERVAPLLRPRYEIVIVRHAGDDRS